MKKILIRWNMPRIMTIGTGIVDGSGIRFNPGVNEKTLEEWNAIKDHPVVKERLEKEIIDMKRGKVKMLEILTDVKKSDKKDIENGGDEGDTALAGLNVKDSKELVKETFDTTLLRSWMESDTRSGVISAIEKQLKLIEDERNDADDDEGSQE